jgi:hypothetical protein
MDLTSRKFWIAVGSILISTALVVLSKLSGGEFVAALSAIYAFYSAGNILDKVVSNDNGTKQ